MLGGEASAAVVAANGTFPLRGPTTSGSDTFYGWGEMLLNNVTGTDKGYGFEITRAYYDDAAGTAITVGTVPVPEPTSIALLAIGAGGLAAWRRRKAARGS